MIGTRLGNRYELLEQIGEGGMALVYKAKCHLLNRYVAVKILKDQYSSDTEFVEKFKREARSAASLSDNNIVNIYDVGSEGDINYIVMEYIKGKTLKEIIKEEGRLENIKAVNIALQIAKALECAHKNNIIHRDIKPHNILVTEEGIAKVTDFGIAKASDSVTITNSSKVMGSAHYFSPEQAKGSFVDGRTDIYSLGIVIYEMTTGRVPYDAESPVSVALKHIQEPVVAPKQINDNIPESLNRLILKAMEKEPIRRYQTIKDMIMDLKKIENNQELNIATNTLDDDMTRVMDPVVVNDKVNKNDKYKDYDDDYDDDEGSYESKGRRSLDSKKKRRVLMIAVAILVLVIGGVSGYFAYSKNASEKDVVVPNIVGMKQDEAKKAVEDKKLKFVTIGKEKSDKPEGTILRTYPQEGTKVKINSEVRVSISGGKDTLGVPNVVKLDLEQAKEFINNSGLKLGDVTRKYSDSVPKGAVISQDPEPDANADANTKVNLVVSSGPEIKTITVPDVTNKSLDDAVGTLSGLGLKVSKNAVNTGDKSLDGKVKGQSIGAGEQVRQWSSIVVYYYQYKEPEPKPNNEDPNKKPNEDPNKKPNEDPNKKPNEDSNKNPGGTAGDGGNTTDQKKE